MTSGDTALSLPVRETPSLRSAGWFRGLTVQERLLALRRAKKSRSAAFAIDEELAAQRLAQWRDESSLRGALPLIDPLKLHSCSNQELLEVLGGRMEEAWDRSPAPSWLRQLEAAFAPVATPSESLEMSGDWSGVEFLVALECPINAAKSRLRSSAASVKRAHPPAPFSTETVPDLLFEHLVPRLTRLLVRPVVLELHAARLAGQLQGATPQLRFQNFVASLRNRETSLGLLHEYPVLARLTMSALDDWVNFSLEFLLRLAQDWEPLSTSLGLPQGDVLTEVRSVGDRHRGGRTVLVATFESAGALVYKPRPVSVEARFQDLIRWLNERVDLPPLRPITVIPRGDYGWSEFVRAKPCKSRSELRRFYKRQGSHLALLYALAATDFHFENVIAAGEHPVLVDLECLFQAFSPRALRSLVGAERLAAETTFQSVLAVGLLPRPDLIGADLNITDLSGLGAAPGQLAPVRLPLWDGSGTDEMRQVLRHAEMLEMQHSPIDEDAGVALRDFVEDVVTGFVETYRVLRRHRRKLLAENGPIGRFAHDEMRCLLRPTLDYALLLDSSFHPHFLCDGVHRDRRFDRLLGAKAEWENSSVVDAERRDLWRTDIPFFATRPDSRHIWTSTGRRIEDFFDETGLDVVKRRLAGMSDADLERQCWMVRMSIASSGLAPDTLEYPRAERPKRSRPARRDRLLDSARAIGERLSELAIRTEGEATWIGVRSRRGADWRVEPVNADLYGGHAGISLFLSYLSWILGDEHSAALARAALPPLHRQIERDLENLSCGAFDGASGLIYALTHLSVLWNDEEPLRDAQRLVDVLPSMIDTDTSADVISGAAGCIAALMSVSEFLSPPSVLTAVRRCGDHLLDSALDMEEGIGWPTGERAWKPLGGFAHGSAGIAWPLLELGALTGEKRFSEAGLAAIAYQRSLFSPDVRNWRDLREFGPDGLPRETAEGNFMSYWCHGSAGIALAWLACSRYLDDNVLRDETAVAVQTTRETGFGSNHCLCHGDLGNVDALLEAAKAGLGVTVADTQAISAGILASIEKRGWLTGFPLGLEAPGLMMGLAGIGYGLLRLAEPEQVPSVLLLESPPPHI